jgi:hypothetical protein
MAHFRGNGIASGGPGDEPRWTGAAKDGVGTAHSMGGRVWFTIGQAFLPRSTIRQSTAHKCAICGGNGKARITWCWQSSERAHQE